jgi:transcriptional regulator GlxA family with amidase domain
VFSYFAEFLHAAPSRNVSGMSLFEIAPSPTRTAQHCSVVPGSVDRARRRPSRRELVGRVTGFLRDNLGEPVTIAELSRMAGVSERTLRTAFREAVGLSPKQYTIAERLRAAHDALQAADPKTTTVTDIAMEYGFFELGRFAGRYRDTFGESPSRTLRHIAAAVRPEQAA